VSRSESGLSDSANLVTGRQTNCATDTNEWANDSDLFQWLGEWQRPTWMTVRMTELPTSMTGRMTERPTSMTGRRTATVLNDWATDWLTAAETGHSASCDNALLSRLYLCNNYTTSNEYSSLLAVTFRSFFVLSSTDAHPCGKHHRRTAHSAYKQPHGAICFLNLPVCFWLNANERNRNEVSSAKITASVFKLSAVSYA